MIAHRLQRLRSEADRLLVGWVPAMWERVDPAGREQVEMAPVTFPGPGGAFVGLRPQPGSEAVLRTRLDVPETLAGVRLRGDPLEVAVDSIYPLRIARDGHELFDEAAPTVAVGPALIRVLDEVSGEGGGTLEVAIRFPDHQLTPWVRFRFTTPGLRRRHELLDIAWARLTLAAATARSQGDRAALQAAAELVPDDALVLDDDDLESLSGRLVETLARFEERVSGMRVHCVAHSHIDMNWLWTWSDTVEVIRRDFRSVLSLMRRYPELTFVHSQPVTYEVIQESEPDLFAEVRDRIAEGRWEPATLQYVECDTNMVAGEAMCRQLQEAVTYTRTHLGRDPTVLLAPDTFGHAGNLPQLAASAGATVYYHHRCNPSRREQRWPAYWWEGQDGSRLLAVSTSRYSGDITAGALAAAAAHALEHGLQSALYLYGVGDHGGGPTRENLDALRRLRGLPMLPRAVPSTIDRYAREVIASRAPLPVHRGESATIFEGCYTTHADVKRANRDGENMLLTAETLAAMAGVESGDRLTPAWRTTLFNQFHDILDGSAISEVYDGVRSDLATVTAAANGIIDEALHTLEDGRRPGSIAVTNQLGWSRRDAVVLPGWEGSDPLELVAEDGSVTAAQPGDDGLCFVADVPAFATVFYEPRRPRASPREGVSVEELSGVGSFELAAGRSNRQGPAYVRLESPRFEATIRLDSGIITSLVDKRAGRQLVAYGMRRQSDYLDSARADLAFNVFQLLREHPHGMSAWHLDEVHTESSLLTGASVRVIESGPVRAVLEVLHAPGRSSVRERIAFYRDLGLIDLDVALDWQEPGGPDVGVPNIKLAFTADLDAGAAWFESPFGAARRAGNGQEVPGLRWAAIEGDGYGLAVLNDGRYGHDALGSRLRVTLARTAYEPDAASDIGAHRIGLRLVPHEGDWAEASIPRRAAEFNQPLLARVVEGKPERVRRLRPDRRWRPELSGSSSVLCSCFKVARDDSGVVLRFYESSGRPGRMRIAGLPSTAVAWETSVVEDRIRALDAAAGALDLRFEPWQVRTVLIETESP